MLKGFSYSGFSTAIVMLIIGLITQASYILYGIIIATVCFGVIILLKLKHYNLGYITLLLPLNLIFIYRSLLIHSAYSYLFTTTVLITSSILLTKKSIHLFFAIDIIFLIYGLISGRFVITQIPDPETGLYYVNTVTVALPILFISYIIALLISKIFIQSITNLQLKNQELQATQEQLIQQEKIKSIQILAGGIAHDFNNILTAVLGNIDLIKISGLLDEENQGYIEDTLNALKNARNLTSQLLSFSKPMPIKKENLDINELIKETAIFTLRGKKSQPFFEFFPDLWMGYGDKLQISQVIQNITLNADQSMETRGKITFYTKNIEISVQNREKLSPGPYLLITIEDMGKGIPPEAYDSIFNPFYTTKESGSGLGLAVSYNIVKNHGGTIIFESQVGVGTKFQIYLPAQLKGEDLTKNQSTSLQKWTGKALIMDDDEGVRITLKRFLTRLGFEVDLTINGEEAIKIYQDQFNLGQPYDLVILDLTIPGGIGGDIALEKLKKINPQIKALISSGYSKEIFSKNFQDKENVMLLKKPYTIEELSEILQQLNIKSKNG
jgi:signal transduction histidine kinase/ActR/RegA family two-component response regulator